MINEIELYLDIGEAVYEMELDGDAYDTDTDMAIIVRHADIDDFEGPYEVTPSDDEQVLPAGGLRMRRNVTVYAVPFDLAERQDIDRLF